MKRILSVFLLLVLCMLAIACSKGETTTASQTTEQTTKNSTTAGTTAASTTTQSTVAPQQRPEVLPTAPEGLTETVRYECGTDGFFIIKEYFDEKGNRLEEHYYAIDSELGILDCKIVAYNTVDSEGNLIKSQGHYISNPYYAVRETVLVIEAIEHEKYDYKVIDEDGNVNLYIKETKNANGKVTREEYFTKGGRFLRAEEMDYRDDGTLSANRGKNAKNELTYETLYNEKGNFVSCIIYDEASRVNTKITAEYYANRVIKAYKTTLVGENGGEGITSITDFYDDGRIKKHHGKDYRYSADGKLTHIYYLENVYKFDEDGYYVSYSGRANGQLGTSISIKYTYDNYGRLTSCVTQNTKNGAKATVSYKYNEDGSAIVRHTNVYGITNNILYTDAKGRLIKSEVYNNVLRTSYQTVEYDAYGNVIKVCEYKNDSLNKEYIYKYNEHGDLVKTETKSGGATEYTEYEYFENGYVKSVVLRDRWGISDKTVYYEDGGYTHTDYTLGKEHSEITYDKYGNEIKTIYFGGDYDEITVYERYPDGTQKKIMVYHDDVLQSGVEYMEGGVTATKRYERDENGVLVVTEYTYENNQPVREDIYKDDIYTGYVTFEYFTENPHIVKICTEYDAGGKKVYYVEYESYMNPAREEFYKNGVLVSYLYKTFIYFDGVARIDTTEELKDGKTTKVDYEYDSDGRVIRCTTFENDNEISTSVYIYSEYSTGPRRITTYDSNGNVIEIRENDNNGNLEEMYRYEYHPNGALKIMSKWQSHFGDSEVMVKKTVYNESGAVVLEEWYDRFAAVTKKYSYVYLQNGKLDYMEKDVKGVVSRTYCIYGEDGKLLKTETFESGSVTEYTDFVYYKNGILKEEITYSVLNSRQEAVKTYDENGRLIKECGRPSKRPGDTEYVWGDEYTYTYGENGRVAEKCHKNINLIDLWIERYEYHENGEISVRKTYWKDADGNERPNGTKYFDENGYEIYR